MKLVPISHLLLQLLIEPTIRFFVDRNDERDKISYKFFSKLLCFFWKINFHNLLLINLFKSDNKRLNSVKNEVTLKSILTLGCRADSLKILATSEKIAYSLCVVYNCLIADARYF